MEKLMTLREVADYLRVTKKTIYRMLNAAEIPATKVGRQWRFDKTAIDDWLRSKSISSKANILVIDDEEAIRSLFKEMLGQLGYKIASAANGLEGLQLIEQNDFDLVFLDLKMPEMDGAELYGRVKTIKPELPVIIITGYPESELMTRALTYGPFGIMHKPFSQSDIVTAVNNFLRIIKS
jgi:excisionase family DNA binding protein